MHQHLVLFTFENAYLNKLERDILTVVSIYRYKYFEKAKLYLKYRSPR